MKKASEVLNKQTAFSQWYEEAGIKNSELFKKEDEEKNSRLKILHEVIGLPTNLGLEMSVDELLQLKQDSALLVGGKPIAEAALGIRLVPASKDDQLYRTRGKRLKEIQEWVQSLHIDPDGYRVNILPHVEDPDCSAIFVVTKNGIKGEAIFGGPHLLTQGFHAHLSPIAFFYDFDQLHISGQEAQLSGLLLDIFDRLKITESQYQQLDEKLTGAGRNHGYLSGYFETITSGEYGLWFIDFNRFLGRRLADLDIQHAITPVTNAVLKGLPVSRGQVAGKAVLVSESSEDQIDFQLNDILVCKMTTPKYIPLMKLAGAILTEQGGLLSHAAIISRELGKPCIAGIKNLLDSGIDQQLIAVDADKGIVTFS